MLLGSFLLSNQSVLAHINSENKSTDKKTTGQQLDIHATLLMGMVQQLED